MERKVYEFIAAQTGEKILERKKCPECGEEFAITDKDMEFYDKVSPTFDGQKYSIPTPVLCPDCRQRKRLSWKNEMKLYKTKCDLTDKNIISMFNQDSIYKVYDQKERWSDNWDAVSYGRKFDFSKPFFVQFDELLRFIPHINLNNSESVNSDYCNDSRNNKNCYFVFASDTNEDSQYLWNCKKLDFSLDCSNIDQGANCYESFDGCDLYQCFYCNDCNSCADCYFCHGCDNCQNCFLCTDLKNKQYCINNVQYSQKEYEQKLSEIFDGNYIKLKDLINQDQNNLKKRIYQNLKQLNCENSFNNYTYDSVNCQFSFQLEKSSNVKNALYCAELSTSQDLYLSGWSGDKLYNTVGCWGKNYLLLFCAECRECSNSFYSKNCYNSSNLFGCVGLRNKQYCILNRQYTKEEYEALMPKIIEHMKSTGERGEFFPANISPFGYNETVANDYFPLDKDEALKQGFKRQDKEYPINIPEGIELIKAQDLPENINDVSDEILTKAVVCEVSGKPFRIVRPELEFYRKHNLPLPRKHPDIRHLDRVSKRPPRDLHLRNCDNCAKQVISVYPQNSEFKVFCDECYKKEIY